MPINKKFEVRVLTKREAVRTRIVQAPWEEAARQHVLHSMKKSDDRILSVRPSQ